eukprot:TRINITY_DN8459_c0_g1_i5.p2 TRINITY_DN8459_c0_g1~~TRINITY_DN8459_c0_g1_i5.p2  ORF type:complete len:168 (+),score=35.88 TRINITY_DN8459_c0_g1_i5:266-769(+)
MGLVFRKLPTESAPVVSCVKEESAAALAVLEARTTNAAAARVLVPGTATLSRVGGVSCRGLSRAEGLAALKAASMNGAWPVELEFELARCSEQSCEFPPPLPRCFSGESRLGTADGRVFVNAYTLKRFVKECGGMVGVGAQMYAAFLEAWHAAGEHEHTLHTWRTTC